MKYGLLHYRGERASRVASGTLLGFDETYRPFVVTDTAYDGDTDMTTVWLQTASGDEIKAAQR